MQNEKIIKAIEEYLNNYTVKAICYDGSEKEIYPEWPGIKSEIAAEIAAAIAPYLEAGAGTEKDLPYVDLFNHMANEHGLILTQTELGDIIHVARVKILDILVK